MYASLKPYAQPGFMTLLEVWLNGQPVGVESSLVQTFGEQLNH